MRKATPLFRDSGYSVRRAERGAVSLCRPLVPTNLPRVRAFVAFDLGPDPSLSLGSLAPRIRALLTCSRPIPSRHGENSSLLYSQAAESPSVPRLGKGIYATRNTRNVIACFLLL